MSTATKKSFLTVENTIVIVIILLVAGFAYKKFADKPAPPPVQVVAPALEAAAPAAPEPEVQKVDAVERRKLLNQQSVFRK